MSSDNIEQALFVRLNSSTTGSATAVYDVFAGRIFVDAAEATSTRPYATFFLVSDPHEPASYGVENAGQARVQFNIYSTDRFKARSAAKLIRTNIHHFQGSIDGLSIQKVRCAYPTVQRDPDEAIYSARFDALIDYSGG